MSAVACIADRPKIRIVLYGKLRRQFGAEREWGVSDPAAAIRALCRLHPPKDGKPGFADALKEGSYRIIRGKPRADGIHLGAEALHVAFGACRELHIIPAARGAKSQGTAAGIKIVVGVVILAVAVIASGGIGAAAAAGAGEGLGAFAGAMGASTPLLGLTYGNIAMMGLGLIITGAAALLSPHQKAARPTEGAASDASFIYDGPVMVSEQGRPVPVVYGPDVLCGGVVIGVDYRAEDIGIANQPSNTGLLGSGYFGIAR